MLSVVVPVFNEEASVEKTLCEIAQLLSGEDGHELIVIDDGSNDRTPEILKTMDVDFRLITHPENLGYGRALLQGIMAARNECVAIIDADGSYPVKQIPKLLQYYPQYDMVVGARKGKEYKRGIAKRPSRLLFNFLAQYATGNKVPDVNSGLRIFKRDVVLRFKDSLCAGFSFTTTLTLLFSLNYYFVKYVDIEYHKRKGRSKVKHYRDTLRAGQVFVEAFLNYNPIKLFLLMASVNAIFGLLLAVVNHISLQSWVVDAVAALCIAAFLPIFCLGLLAEQQKKVYHSHRASCHENRSCRPEVGR